MKVYGVALPPRAVGVTHHWHQEGTVVHRRRFLQKASSTFFFLTWGRSGTASDECSDPRHLHATDSRCGGFPGDTPPTGRCCWTCSKAIISRFPRCTAGAFGHPHRWPMPLRQRWAGVESMPLWLGYGPARSLMPPERAVIPAVLPEGDPPHDCWCEPSPTPTLFNPKVSPNEPGLHGCDCRSWRAVDWC